MPARDQLTALDATFLELEEADDGALMHIGAALVFEPLPSRASPTISTLREHLSQRLDSLPRYRQKLDPPHTGGLSWPSWKLDEHFEIEAHVRHATLPSPGAEDDFMEWLSDFYSHRLDRSRPLWEMVLLDGLETGRWALVCKTHHCLIDGVGSVDLVGLLLDPEPASAGPSGSDPGGSSSSDDVPASRTWHGWLAEHPFAPVVQLAGLGLAAARSGVHAGVHTAMHPRDALARSRGVVDLLVRDELIRAPDSSLNAPIGTTRRIAAVRVELGELQKIRSALGGTVNDVVLCAAAGALRQLLLARGEEPPGQGLRAMVPVNLRGEGADSGLGNKVSSLFIDLPVAEADPLDRFELLVAATARGKAGGQARAASALTALTEFAPPVLHAGLARALFAKRLFNVTITNVPGAPVTVGAFGATMVDVVPIVPLAADHAIGVAVVSYAGGLTFGLCADRATVPDLDVLKDGIVSSLAELAEFAHSRLALR
jgi:diacylglycerol O-acyltransferase / wax synthase